MQGDKVKLSLQFRGREIEMQSIGRDLFQVLIKPYSFSEYRHIDRHCLFLSQAVVIVRGAEICGRRWNRGCRGLQAGNAGAHNEHDFDASKGLSMRETV